MSQTETAPQIAALLAWYAEAGVDIALDGAPLDRFSGDGPPGAAAFLRQAQPQPVSAPAPPVARAESRSLPDRPLPRVTPQPMAPALASSSDRAESDARALAEAAPTIEALEQAVRDFNGCALKATAKNTCFADGNPKARLMFIGEAPGRDEDLQGKPFVGRAGQLLDKMIAAIGMKREDVYITNTVYWRPPGNRTPTPAETAACRPFTERQIELVAPDVLVFLGGAAAKTMLETSEGIMRLRGKWRVYRAAGRDIDAMATLHPAYLLRQPAQKRQAWQDFLKIKLALHKKS